MSALENKINCYYSRKSSIGPDIVPNSKLSELLSQLAEIRHFSTSTTGKLEHLTGSEKAIVSEHDVVCGLSDISLLTPFARKVITSRLLEVGTCLYHIHGPFFKKGIAAVVVKKILYFS